MARGPDGKTIRPGNDSAEETTHKVERRSIKDRIAGVNPSAEAATRIVDPTTLGGDDAMGHGGPGEYIEDETQPDPVPVMATASDDDPKTQVYRPQRARQAKELDADDKPGGETSQVGDDHTVTDPVVGWLVVVDGPGRGNGFSLGYGNNRVGREPTQRVVLDFGDSQISRENHATITYDGKNGRFFVKEGDGRNLTYVGDDPVLVPVELKGGEVLTMGETKLQFVPFCGEDFSWETK